MSSELKRLSSIAERAQVAADEQAWKVVGFARLLVDVNAPAFRAGRERRLREELAKLDAAQAASDAANAEHNRLWRIENADWLAERRRVNHEDAQIERALEATR